jgi:hypothetical protein
VFELVGFSFQMVGLGMVGHMVMMVGETLCVLTKVSCGCVSTFVVCQPQVMWLCANPRSCVPFNKLILGWELGSTHLVIRLLNRVVLTAWFIAHHVIYSQHVWSINHKCICACFTFPTTYIVQKMVKMRSTLVRSSSSWFFYHSIACGVIHVIKRVHYYSSCNKIIYSCNNAL